MFHRLLILLVILSACKNQVDENSKEISWSKEKSTQMNKDFLIEEDLRIKMYIESRPNLKTKRTGSGLRYFIYKKGDGILATTENIAVVKYSIELLDGTKCYATQDNETVEFKIDKSDVESGIQEGIKKMQVGDKAKFIIPSHLAHGLTGDLNQIPPLQTLIVDLELIELKK